MAKLIGKFRAERAEDEGQSLKHEIRGKRCSVGRHIIKEIEMNRDVTSSNCIEVLLTESYSR
jgi:hypothetical protein